MKKITLLVVLVLTLLASSSVFAAENWVDCVEAHMPPSASACEALGGNPVCEYSNLNSDGSGSYSARCDISDWYESVPICSGGGSAMITISPTTGKRYTICPQGEHLVYTHGGKREVNILPPVPQELLTALFGPVGTTPYQDVVNVPEGKVLIVRTQANRGLLRFDSEIIKGWTAGLNMPLAYTVSKRCFAEAIAEEPMMYRLLPATMQEDNQYWLRCKSLEPIIVGCSDKGVVSPQELEELRIEEPWKNFIKILSHQGDPWAFRPVVDEDGNIIGPSPKLGFFLK